MFDRFKRELKIFLVEASQVIADKVLDAFEESPIWAILEKKVTKSQSSSSVPSADLDPDLVRLQTLLKRGATVIDKFSAARDSEEELDVIHESVLWAIEARTALEDCAGCFLVPGESPCSGCEHLAVPPVDLATPSEVAVAKAICNADLAAVGRYWPWPTGNSDAEKKCRGELIAVAKVAIKEYERLKKGVQT